MKIEIREELARARLREIKSRQKRRVPLSILLGRGALLSVPGAAKS